MMELQHMLERFLRQFKDVELLDSPFSIIDGEVGRLLINLNLNIFLKDDIYKKMIDISIIRLLKKEMKFAFQNNGLWTSPVAFLYVTDLIQIHTKDKKYADLNMVLYESYRPILMDYLKSESPFMEVFNDYIYGFSGIIFFLRQHSIAKADKELQVLCLKWIKKLLSSDLINLFETNQNKDKFIKENNLCGHEYVIMGMAHGFLGLIHQIDGWYKEFSILESQDYKRWNVLVEEIIETIISRNIKSKLGIIIPKVLKIDNCRRIVFEVDVEDKYFNYSWCHGAIGLMNFCNLYSKRNKYKNEIDLKLYNECIKSLSTNYCDEIIVDHCICHGLAGLYYYLFVNKLLNYELMNETCINLFHYYDNSTFIEKDNFQLLDANGGAFLVLLSLINKKRFIGDELFGYV